MTRFIRSAAALALAAGVTLAVAQPAHAADTPQTHYATGTWQVRDWPGTYPEITPVDAEKSTADCDTVTLTKTKGDIGTSDENTDLGLAVTAGSVLQVDYTLDSTDDAATTAVRMFAYDHADADTVNTAPTYDPAIADPADGLTGTLEIVFDADTTVGTFGLTYDASNATAGTVTFTNLRLLSDDVATPIAFCAAPAPEQSPTAEPTTAEPTTTMSTAPAATLPVTGAPLTGVVVAGVVLIAVGAVVYVIFAARRRNG